MSIEHRYNTRLPANFRLLFQMNKQSTHLAWVRDFSDTGMFLKVGEVKVPCNSTLEFVFHHNKRPYKVKALVIHKQTDGIGVLFIDPDHRCLRALSLLAHTWLPSTDPTPAKSTG